MRTFKSRVYVLVPGNFVSVHIGKLSGNYKVLNSQEFIDKFFEVHQQHPFCYPEVKLKDNYKGLNECVFEITKPGKEEKYIINLNKVFVQEVNLKEVKV